MQERIEEMLGQTISHYRVTALLGAGGIVGQAF